MSKALKEAIILTASYYNHPLSAPVLAMYAEELMELPEAEVIEAYRAYRRDPKNRTNPLPAQIKAIVRPSVDPESAAREIAARITTAIRKFGYDRGIEAREFIGEVGWQVVQRQAGWSYLCGVDAPVVDPAIRQAQLRDLALSILKHSPEAMAQAIGTPSAASGQKAIERANQAHMIASGLAGSKSMLEMRVSEKGIA